jgi:hypothetical protein
MQQELLFVAAVLLRGWSGASFGDIVLRSGSMPLRKI